MNTSNAGGRDSSKGVLDQESGSQRAEIESLIPCLNLTERVRHLPRQGTVFKEDPSYEAFFNQLARALHRSVPRHILLIRERGVAEQTVLAEFAGRMGFGEYPHLREKKLIFMDGRHITAEESREFVEVLFQAISDQEDSIVCIDGIGTLLAGVGQKTIRGRLLRHLIGARCRIVGLLSPGEYEESAASDADFQEVFTKLSLHEPDAAVAAKLVRQIAVGLEQQYAVEIESAAINRTISLSHSYILCERLPSKAIKVLRLLCDDVQFDRLHNIVDRKVITDEDVVHKISEISGVPPHTLAGIGDRVDYEVSLGEVSAGQSDAVKAVASELALIRAGFAESGKPASVMLFIGQTGTGKTEMAKALARFYSSARRLKTFTLGNFSEPHSVSGIIGVPPGYVGHDQGGRLINDLNADPYGVFLLDEADKAHPDVLQPFLNLFDEGWIYDQRGVKAVADRAIFILTTNVGQKQIADMFRDNKTLDEITNTIKETLARTKHSKSNRPVFSPEFLARLKRIVIFRSLSCDAMQGIARRLVSDMTREWRSRRQRVLSISDQVSLAIASEAFDRNELSQGKEGGRIVRKLLKEYVELKIQQAIAADPDGYQKCMQVNVALSDESLGSAQGSSVQDRVRINFD